MRKPIKYQSTADVVLRHPTDVRSNPENSLDNTNDGSTCSYRVFDAGKDETLTATEPGAEVVLAVANAGVFEVGDTAVVYLDDGSLHAAGVTAVDALAGTVTIDMGLASQAASGARIRARLVDTVNMPEFGTAQPLADDDWGFRAALNVDPPVFYVGQEVDVEITFVGALDGSLDQFKVVECEVVLDVEEEC